MDRVDDALTLVADWEREETGIGTLGGLVRVLLRFEQHSEAREVWQPTSGLLTGFG